MGADDANAYRPSFVLKSNTKVLVLIQVLLVDVRFPILIKIELLTKLEKKMNYKQIFKRLSKANSVSVKNQNTRTETKSLEKMDFEFASRNEKFMEV